MEVADIFTVVLSASILVDILSVSEFSDCKAPAMWVPPYELEVFRIDACKVIADVYEPTDYTLASVVVALGDFY